MNALEDGYIHCMYCEHRTLYTIVYQEASFLYYDIVYVVRVPQMEKYEQRKKASNSIFVILANVSLAS